jgi:hypothetical protein
VNSFWMVQPVYEAFSNSYLIFQLGRPFIDVLDHLYMLLEEKEQRKIMI